MWQRKISQNMTDWLTYRTAIWPIYLPSYRSTYVPVTDHRPGSQPRKEYIIFCLTLLELSTLCVLACQVVVNVGAPCPVMCDVIRTLLTPCCCQWLPRRNEGANERFASGRTTNRLSQLLVIRKGLSKLLVIHKGRSQLGLLTTYKRLRQLGLPTIHRDWGS